MPVDVLERARDVVAALGGRENVRRVEHCAETRVRIEVIDDRRVDDRALAAATPGGIMRVSSTIWHLVIGTGAALHARAMQGVREG